MKLKRLSTTVTHVNHDYTEKKSFQQFIEGLCQENKQTND